MSDISILSSQLHSSQHLLSVFTKSIQQIQLKDDLNESEKREIRGVLLPILLALEQGMSDKISSDCTVNGETIISNLQSLISGKYRKDWNIYSQGIVTLYYKVSTSEFSFTNEDIGLLNDIAEALDTECDNLFNCMGKM